ncbi:hypothetical protein [Oerskovia merdavium]|uniref:Uncharacterized protein n=1 Tax=Oerskovia merdavium TaxID=2762227 RepID=A0ABR8TXM4_9CELL|nr:hypothetical protein [Oerskovia merdavium]MBD7980218.1 hypothetical protein [Oerskovia merdavium]
MATNLLAGVLEAQTRNSLLAGDDLLRAAQDLVEALSTRRHLVMASDSVGDRVLGAALLLEPSIPLADRSSHFNGAHVMLVAGHISGDARMSMRACSVRALGALRVEAAMLTHWGEPIEGLDAILCIGSESSLRVAALA